MTSLSLILTLKAESLADKFTLTWGKTTYSIVFQLESDVILKDLLRRLRPVLIGSADPSGQLEPLALLREIGTRLWMILLPDTAPTAECAALAREIRTSTTPLLLALPQSLSMLPWELLCDPGRTGDSGFVVRQRPLVRLISSGSSGPSDGLPALAPPLKVLLLISSPPRLSESQRVDVESERAAVEGATRTFREAGQLHLYVEDIVTPQRVQQALLRFKPHIMHYIGHGSYGEETGGFLIWENDNGDPLPMSSTRLASLLQPRQLRAVVLHGCKTASDDPNADIRGVARELVNAGIPAVLAQQANFTYESSQRASEMFYTALTSGLGMAEATYEARQALSQADRPDWAVPTLEATVDCTMSLLDPYAAPGPSDPSLITNQATIDLPAPTGVFVGRQRELRALRKILESAPDTGPVLSLITGPGGVGKSTLAAQAVTRYGRRYKAVLTLSCAGYQGFDLFLQRIAEFLKRQGVSELFDQVLSDPKLSVEAKIEVILDALNRTGPFLLLMDNLESVQSDDRSIADPHLLQFLQKLLTNLRGGRVLITGRYAVANLLPDGRFAANLLRLDLDDLSGYEVHQLLERYSDLAHLGDAVKTELVNEFGGLPYIYDLLSSAAASQDLAALIHDVQGRITRERQERADSEWEGMRQRVIRFAALEATIARLPKQTQKLLGQLVVFKRAFPLQAMEQGLGATSDDWQPLVNWALLRYDAVAGDYRLHSLTAHYAEKLLDPDDRKTTQLQIARWYFRYSVEESHSLDDALESYQLYKSAGESLEAGKLATALADRLRKLGLYQLLRDLLLATIYDEPLSKTKIQAEAQRQLGILFEEQGQYEQSKRLYDEALKNFEQLNDQNGQALTMHELAIVLQNQGEYEKAKQLFRKVLLLTRSSGDFSSYATVLQHLGIIAQMQGNPELARQYHEESLQIRRQRNDQEDIAVTLQELGTLAYEQNQYEDARNYFTESLEIKKRLGNVGGRAITLMNLGVVAEAEGKLEEAWQCYSESMTIAEHLNNQELRSKLLLNLGKVAYDQGGYDEALSFFSDAFNICKRIGNLDGCALSLTRIGLVMGRKGDYKAALRYQVQALTIFEQLHMPQRLDALGIINLIRTEVGNATFAQLWEEVAPEKPLPRPPVGKLSDALVAFLEAKTWTASRSILEAHSDLLQETVDTQLADLADAQQAESGRRAVEMHRTLLTRCRAVGIPAAFAELSDDQKQSSENDFATQLERICNNVVAALLDGDQTQREVLAAQIDAIAADSGLLDDPRDFLTLLGSWLRGADSEHIVQQAASLRPDFLDLYKQMIAYMTNAQQSTGIGTAAEKQITLAELLKLVYLSLTQGTDKHRQELILQIIGFQQDVQASDAQFAAFLGCLVMLLQGELVDTSSLASPFIELWQELLKLIQQNSQHE